MIQVDGGKLKMTQNPVELMSELTTLFKGIVDTEVLDKKAIDKCWEIANYTDEELHKRVDKVLPTVMEVQLPALMALAAAGNKEAEAMVDYIMDDIKKMTGKTHENE